jgi:hypothetical protein
MIVHEAVIQGLSRRQFIRDDHTLALRVVATII